MYNLEFKIQDLLSHPREPFKYFNQNLNTERRNSLSSRVINNTTNGKPTTLNKPTSANELIEFKKQNLKENNKNSNNSNINNNYIGGTRSNSVNKNFSKTIGVGANKKNNSFVNNLSNNNEGISKKTPYELDKSDHENSPKRGNNLKENKIEQEKNLFKKFMNRNSDSNSKLLSIGSNRQQLPSIGSISKSLYPRDTFSSGFNSRVITENSNHNVNSNAFNKSMNPNRFTKNSSYSSNNIPDQTYVMKNIEKINGVKKPYTTSKISKNDSKVGVSFDSNTCILEYALKDEQNAPYRNYMEDFMKVTHNFLGDSSKILFGLYDGHGGFEVAKIVKEKLPDIFAKNLSDNKNCVETALTNSFKKLDDQLKNHENVGSTGNLTYICKENGKRVIYSANIGDSRTVLIRRNKAERLSYDHKGTDFKEIERIRLTGGIIFGGRVFGQLAISRAFGDYSLKTYGVSAIPYVSKTVIDDSDTYVIMGSDGVWDVIDEDFVYKMSQGISNSEEFAKIIISDAMTLGSIDNISCIVIKLN